MTNFSGTQLGLVYSVRWEGRENNKIRTGLYLQRGIFSSGVQINIFYRFICECNNKSVFTTRPPLQFLVSLVQQWKYLNVGYPFTSTAPQMAENFVQSTAANSTFGSSLKCSAAAVNSGFAFLQCPHPEATRTPWKSQLVLLKYQVLWSYSCTKYIYKWAIPWLRQSVASIPLWSPTFNPRPVYMGYEVDRVVLGQDISFSPISTIQPMLYTH